MKKLLGVLALLSMAAKPVVNPREDGAYSRAGRPVWGQTEYIVAAGEFIPDNVAAVDTTAAEDPNAPHLFEYGTVVMVTCDVDALGFWLQDVGATTATTGAVTDSGSTAGRTTGANGVWIEAGVTRHMISPTPRPVTGDEFGSETMVSQRTKSCIATTPSSTTGLALYGRPCDATTDCFHSFGVDSCSEADNGPKGNYLKIHPTEAAQCSIEIEH